jgi:DNA-binding YbaB/EbfC family protein
MDMREILERAKEMQQKATDMQRAMADVEVEGVAGGGMVRIVLAGNGALKNVSIDPSLFAEGEREILEDLIVAAHGDAKSKLEKRMADEMSRLAGKFGLPPGLGV